MTDPVPTMTPPAPKAPAPSPTPPAAAPKVIPSTSDERVKNNVVRHEYRVLSDDEKKQMKAVKDAGLAFIELIDSMGSTRELSLAKTNAQQAVMWAVNHITR